MIPLGARAVVRRLKKEKTESGLYIPEYRQDGSLLGEVVSVGEECTWVRPGDRVFFGKFAPLQIDIDEAGFDGLNIVEEVDILARLEAQNGSH